MSRRMSLVLAGLVASSVLAGCSGSSDDTATDTARPTSTTAPVAEAGSPTTRTPIDGVQTYAVVASHVEGTITYPEVPPVGGAHNPAWQPCTFYDQPVPNEKAVHSLEHGAIWITYRPDLPVTDVDALATLARSRKDVVASRWDVDLPSPVVATAWGRQLRLPSAGDPRLVDFIRLYTNKGPEPNAPC